MKTVGIAIVGFGTVGTGVVRLLVANRITAFLGILNGTCNDILTEMSAAGKTARRA